MLTSAPSVSLSWVNTVIAAAERQGVPAPTCWRAGVCTTAWAGRAGPVDDITRLWRAAAALTGMPPLAEHRAPGGACSFNVVSFILLSRPRCGAIGQLQEYQRLISDGGRFQTLAGHFGWLIYHPQQGSLAFSPAPGGVGTGCGRASAAG